ncbi:hypothetical protein ARMSODRAFT_1015958 [Armillaria solidipes]|uniref:Heterokaryon incompatibility domain-containing protein n=1 Tax=Armillaria solidipes TaxID=1076256 RepID=A0A2H3BW15_9AGAR|nr:hypothetical protein ARMSODRAFT_1015958 [Armillaria solidipes]
MRNTKSRIVDQPLPRRIKSFWKRLRAVFSTRRVRKDSSPDATSNLDQNVDGIAPWDPHEEILYQNISGNGGPISEAIPDSLSELQSERLSTSSVVVSQVGPADEHPSGQSSEALDSERFWVFDSERSTLPKVTISATIETGQAESTIKVPKQRNYTGREPVIPSSLADTPCATLGVQGVLDRLNATLGTSHTLDTPSVLSVLEDCIVKNYDFGTAYGRLRGVWNRNNDCTIEDELRTREEGDKERRREALLRDNLMEWTPPPRRVWDLCSNRVVPYGIADRFPQPISHAWVDEKDRMDVWTPINGKEWPVPIPKDTNLNLIRIEMLRLGVTYTWLDVLCLRQKGGPREDLRVEEWKLDVPTIGHVYRGPEGVVIYLSGLGRPLSLKEGDLESNRCWFRRAWTLQEVGRERFIAGDTPDGPMHAEPVDDNGNYETEMLTSFHKQLEHMEETSRLFRLFGTLADMQNRVSTNPVDRVAGLAFRLVAQRAYHESETPEDAWTALVNAMFDHMRAYILFLYPGVGLGCKKWRPTWEQVMMEPLPADDSCDGYVNRDDETDEDWHEGPCIEQGFVRGLNAGLAEGVDRCGELIVKDADGMQHTFKICVTHQFPIPEGAYTLLGSFTDPWDLQATKEVTEFWVVGRSLPDQRFEKLSVIRIPDKGERERLYQCGVLEVDVDVVVIFVVELIRFVTVPLASLVYFLGAKLLPLNASSRSTIDGPASVSSRPARAL